MKKNSHNGNFLDIVNEILSTARNRGTIHLVTTDKSFDGRIIHLKNNHPLINFGSCSYLGLEVDHRLKEAAAEGAQRYGSQFSCSRSYLSCTPYKELEELLGKIFNAPIILNINSTSAHQSIIPNIIEPGDAVIFDQQAHISMQELKYKLSFNGITVDFLRHSRLDELQEKINILNDSHNRIWYFLDGVYSMYGDFAPIHNLNEMLLYNKKLHLYIDDAHSMSVYGKNGTGYVLSQVEQHPKMVITVSLAKGFGSAGGVTIIKDEDMYNKVKNWGVVWTHSGPQQPAVISASIASAKIHLSEEIYLMQKELKDKITYCNRLINKKNLPIVSESETPIFFIGLGITSLAYNMIERLLAEGFYLNLGIFPAVSERCAGLRFTITRNHTKEDIKKLIQSIASHLPVALKEEGITIFDIYKAFRSVRQNRYIPSQDFKIEPQTPTFKVRKENSIRNFSESEWNGLMGKKGNFDWKALSLIEKAFSNNPKPHDNWKFHYYIISDKDNIPIVATFCTTVLVKDDMLSPDKVSEKIERKRKQNPYYLTSKCLMMGTLITEGDQMYVDKSNGLWKEALKQLINILWDEQEAEGANSLSLRDFDEGDEEINAIMTDLGFVKIDMPASNIVNIEWRTREEYIANLSKKKRKHLRDNVLNMEKHFSIKIAKHATREQIDRWYHLYDNVRAKNFHINIFKLPKKLFYLMSLSPDWECVEFRIQEQGCKREKIIGVYFAYKNANYANAIVGLDYKYLEQYKTYRQTLFQTIIRAIELKADKVFFGLTADFEKQKVGATSIQKVAYIQYKDNFNLSLLSLIPQSNIQDSSE